MELQTLIYLFVGVSFAIYIGIALWAKAGSTKDFYVAGGEFIQLQMVWQQQQTGCQQLHLFH